MIIQSAGSLPGGSGKTGCLTILESYVNNYDHSDDRSIWFEKIRSLSVKLGYGKA